jgi:hypothetical protein
MHAADRLKAKLRLRTAMPGFERVALRRPQRSEEEVGGNEALEGAVTPEENGIHTVESISPEAKSPNVPQQA